MSEELPQRKNTGLETTGDVIDTLHWKMQALKTEGRTLEEGIADYIGFTLDNLQHSIVSKKYYIEELKKLIKADEVQIENIKTEGVKFLEQMGVEKLQGHIVSSVSISRGKEAQIKEKKKLKYLVPVEEIEELLISLGKAEYETIIAEVKPTPAKLRVTQRRVKNVEVE